MFIQGCEEKNATIIVRNIVIDINCKLIQQCNYIYNIEYCEEILKR